MRDAWPVVTVWLVRAILALMFALGGCAMHAHVEHPVVDSSSVAAGCGDPPVVARHGWRHGGSAITSMLGSSRHRGVDLIASDADATQTLGGKLAYGATDADLEDEDVVVFACGDHGWRPLGTTRTDEHGRFAMTLADAQRVPVGMHDLYAGVPGDGTGVRFLAYVAPAGTRVLVTDIDGTLTKSEHAMVATVVLGRDIDNQPGAPEALAASGMQVVYVTGRGDQFTNVTRDWLTRHGFPRGPLRLAPATSLASGEQTIAYKANALAALHVPVAFAIGNRATDIAAYARAGVAPDRIYIHLPEFAAEVDGPIGQHHCVGFTEYGKIHWP